MKSFQKAFCTLLGCLFTIGVGAATISDVTARTQNGKVDIDYTITGVDATNTALAVTMIDNDTGKKHTLTEEGRHRITWDTAVEGLNLISSNVTATVSLVRYSVQQDPDLPTDPDTPTENQEPYCVIDLSGGPNATRWPVSYLSSVPTGGWTDTYKTTKLVLRRIEAGTFIMGGDQSDENCRVTLTKPFYMGVFEVTQRQWELVIGSWPGSSPSLEYGRGDTYPAYYISFNDIRGTSSAVVDASGFLGKLCAKTGLDFDLPTETHWEYACRAGSTTTYYWGDAMDDAYAWHEDNAGDKSHPVGTRLPNAWGLYDMSGNVWEWCRPVEYLDSQYRSLRGGSWYECVGYGTSFGSCLTFPSVRNEDIGFRLVMVLSD